MSYSETISLAMALVQRASVTPDNTDCLNLLAERLAPLGFTNEFMQHEEVNNLWARRGDASPLFVFAGHTDVVPSGNVTRWDTPPFEPTIQDGVLYGRGIADMKGDIAAMVTACERFIAEHPQHQGSIAFMLTGDEEGPSINGTVKMVETLQVRQENIDWCLVGEPSSNERLGDTIKNGRRGSLNGQLLVKGIQGHIAYPHRVDNPIHRFAPVLQALCSEQWDQGNDFFPPTTFQFSNLQSGTGADNVVPGELSAWFNFRYSTESTHTALQQRVEALLSGLDYELTWKLSGQPFLTPAGKLVEASQAAVEELCDYKPQLSTSGGTSDGRFIAPTGAEVIELGVRNESIHKVNEQVVVAELEQISAIYQRILEKLLL